jgi:hypothetical protein
MESLVAPQDTHQWLVPIAPELLVSVQSGQDPIIEAITPQLAAWVGQTAEALLGQPLYEVFETTLPMLAPVVERVFTTGEPVRDYRVTFTDHQGVPRTAMLQASQRPGKLGRWGALVALRLNETPSRRLLRELIGSITVVPTERDGQRFLTAHFPAFEAKTALVGREARLVAGARFVCNFAPIELTRS